MCVQQLVPATMSHPVNKMEKKEFLILFENVVENTPKVAEELFKLKYFSSDVTFLESLANVIDALSYEEKVRRFYMCPDTFIQLANLIWYILLRIRGKICPYVCYRT